MKDKNSCILIGLPHSGKSTFIAALWHIIENNELDCSLTITGLPEDREYLNDLRDSWLSCKVIERNKGEYKHHILLNVKDKNSQKITEFIFPDVSGEMYENQFEYRKYDYEFLEMIDNSDGIILFINPQDLREPILISDINVHFENESSETETPKNWNHKLAPTQVVLVDLLQMIAYNTSRSMKLAVIISAWDLVNGNNTIKPSKWIAKSLPLLFQFLNANDTIFTTNYYGISAQGGDYSNDISKLLLISPLERILVQTESDKSKDISLPIKWLLDNE